MTAKQVDTIKSLLTATAAQDDSSAYRRMCAQMAERFQAGLTRTGMRFILSETRTN